MAASDLPALLRAADRVGLHFPTREEWAAIGAGGFTSDGCTHCPDTVWGMGIASPVAAYPPLPCTWHDAGYAEGGDEMLRQLRDFAMYWGIVEMAEERSPLLVMPRRWRAEKILATLRYADQARLHWRYTS